MGCYIGMKIISFSWVHFCQFCFGR